MFYFFVLFLSLSLAWAQIFDTNCSVLTPSGPVWAPVAYACKDKYTKQQCEKIFGGRPATNVPGGSTGRQGGCTNGGGLRNVAIDICPNTCAFCCLTPEFNCNNAPQPLIDCTKVTQPQCKDTAWFSILAANCPNVCGFCLLGDCFDVAPQCINQPTICQIVGLEEFVAENCRKTCGLCGTSTLSPCSSTTSITSSLNSVSSSTCTDRNINCPKWVERGFCSSIHYTTEQKKNYCSLSCNLC